MTPISKRWCLPLPEGLAWLVRKEWRLLTSSRSWWVLLAAMGPLVGASFISAVRTYAELSGLDGTAAGVGEAFSPLVGIWAPTFSACELGAVFLLPFVAINVVAADRQSGALKLELQRPLPAWRRVAAKMSVLLAGWLIATVAPLIAVVLWITYGGSVHLPELGTVLAGHVLNAALTISLAAAAAMLTDHPSTGAIVTLAVTVGTWIITFVAAVQGGLWARIAQFTPAAMVGEFQHGLIRAPVVIAILALVVFSCALTAIWMRLGVPVRRRAVESAIAVVLCLSALGLAMLVRGSVDTSENRMNSFSVADERALRTIHQPLRLTAYLAPEDPRRFDLERHAIDKLRRAVPDFDITYVSATSVGLFEQSNEHYGELHYDLGGRQLVSRATTAEGVLEAIYTLAGTAPQNGDETVFRGHPLAAPPRGAAALFYVIYPAVVGGVFLMSRRHS
jgi:ABC-2 type transport system permease protein